MSATNRTYGGRYAVLEPVGSGGMAEVYRARDELLGRDVAVKVLSARLSSDKSFVERFRREAQSAANLNHPNVVSLYDYGADDGAYYIVMEYIEGKSLGDIVAESGALLPERAAEIASDVAAALERAHSSGLVHRDIKPTNIMVTNTGQTKVTDFGIARALGQSTEQTQMTQTGMVIGTAAYLSPEQAQGNPVDARSDVYSLGCVLYEMLTGRPPFAGDAPLAIAYKHVREDPVPPSTVNPDVPRELDAVTLKALSKNPGNRYTTAAEMREDLQRFLNGQKVLATPLMAAETAVAAPVSTGTQVLRTTETEYAPPPPEPRRGVWYVLAALLILALFGLGAWLLANNFLGGGDEVDVPNVVGLTEEDAVDRLERRGFEVDVEERPSDKPEGDVFRQDPDRGEQAEEGSTVTIFVSTGPEAFEVPDLRGEELRDARRELKQADLTVGTITRQPSEDVPPDTVLDQFPRPPAEVRPGDAVDLVVSSGPEAIPAPSVVGQTEDDAIAEIEALGLFADPIQVPDDAPAGEVIGQDPAPGTPMEEGDVVAITVSTGPEGEPMPDVRGDDADTAEAFLENDFGLSVTQEEGACAAPPGAVCDQDPPPDTLVAPGDSAILYVQPGGAALPGDDLFAFLSLLALFA
ncbi:MAG TPA: Stk1 family PASTA domain-containing Ser/Thr kinase [Actinomycetota bacterium]|nr:Stk1 family PASTA domain-containing Ser/Thr kinase [Actinomycetota bacterium]